MKKQIELALKEVGYYEGKNNDNKFGKFYNANYQPWCMYFVQWIYQHAGKKLPYFTGSCSALLRWYKENAPSQVIKATLTGIKIPSGAIIIYNFGHTGIVLRRWDDGHITTIEGNTSPGVNGSQSNGDGVYVRNRNPGNSDYFIIPGSLTWEEI